MSSDCRGRGFSRPTVFLTVGPLGLLLPSGLKKDWVNGSTVFIFRFYFYNSWIYRHVWRAKSIRFSSKMQHSDTMKLGYVRERGNGGVKTRKGRRVGRKPIHSSSFSSNLLDGK